MRGRRFRAQEAARDRAVAFQAELIDARTIKCNRIGRSMRLVATEASFSYSIQVRVYIWTSLFRVTRHAGPLPRMILAQKLTSPASSRFVAGKALYGIIQIMSEWSAE